MEIKPWRRWESLLDAVAVVVVLGEIARLSQAGSYTPLALLLTATALLLARRWFPLMAAIGAVITSGLVLLSPTGALTVWILAQVCMFSLPLRRSMPIVLVVGTLHAAVLYVGAQVALEQPPLDPVALILPLWTALAVALGVAVRSHTDYLAALKQHAEDAAKAHEYQVRVRVEEERLSVARDLHDVVGNSIAIVKLNAASAARNVETNPVQAQRDLEQVRVATRFTLQELGNIMTLLRRPTNREDAHQALASTAGIGELLASLRASGLTVTDHIDELPLLQPLADAAVYRVVQEGLTNSLKHGDGTALLRIDSTDGENVNIRIENPGQPGASTYDMSGGFGLVGLRERVESAGGELVTAVDSDRFVLTASLPAAQRLQDR